LVAVLPVYVKWESVPVVIVLSDKVNSWQPSSSYISVGVIVLEASTTNTGERP